MLNLTNYFFRENNCWSWGRGGSVGWTGNGFGIGLEVGLFGTWFMSEALVTITLLSFTWTTYRSLLDAGKSNQIRYKPYLAKYLVCGAIRTFRTTWTRIGKRAPNGKEESIKLAIFRTWLTTTAIPVMLPKTPSVIRIRLAIESLVMNGNGSRTWAADRANSAMVILEPCKSSDFVLELLTGWIKRTSSSSSKSLLSSDMGILPSINLAFWTAATSG